MPKKKKTNIKHQLNELLVIIGIVIFSIIFWDSYFIYPIKFFVIILHEISHAIATIVTGGVVKSILISFDLGGVTQTNGGNSIIIASAGYLGSLVIGAFLFVSAYDIKIRKITLTVLSVVLLLSVVGYMQGNIQVFFGLLISIFFFLLPRYLNEIIVSYFLKFIGLISSLYVLTDIKNDLLTTSIRETDAQVIEFLTGIPSLVIGFIMLVISLAVVYVVIRYSLVKSIK
jgi:hypothetical protein